MGRFVVGGGDLDKEARVLWVRQLEMEFLQKKILLYAFPSYSEGPLGVANGVYNDA